MPTPTRTCRRSGPVDLITGPTVWWFGVCSLALTMCSAIAPAQDLVVADFESDSYGDWIIAGEAFGSKPAAGTLPNQMQVSGFRGQRLVNTFFNGDSSTGTATSREFVIQRSHLAFLIGGGRLPGRVGIELLLGGESVRTTTGTESETLTWASWDVADLQGRSVQLRIFDRATGGWGHICVDHIIQTDAPPSRFELESKLAEYRRSPTYMNEPFRPQVHFSPEINWMNDPNGLVFHRGEYHLFYQFNPGGNTWGHMSWGHAVSEDLVGWQHLPLAIPETDGVMAFSGSCVVDHQNTTGFGSPENPPLVAIYTGHGHGLQVQNLAYSLDNGRNWTIYAANPVLDINNKDFRDPKVFWHPTTNRWIMVVSLAAEKVILFYGSSDLKQWRELSRFGPAGTKNKPNWECPDLFELTVENEPGAKRWVLEADMGSGSVAGGSGGEYFVGQFDGTRFVPLQEAAWVDFGRDFYAPVSWSDIPESDGRRIWIGWFNNWETCLVPTSPWRSCMSVPRSLTLRKVESQDHAPNRTAEYVMVQRPIHELRGLRTASRTLDTRQASWPPTPVTTPGELNSCAFELEATLRPGTARSCGFRLRTGDAEYTEFGYDREPGVVYVDRRESGNVDFHPAFPGRHEAPVRVIDGRVRLHLIVDRSTVELFINDGEAVISDRIFPNSTSPVIEVFSGDPTATVGDVTLHQLESIWHRPGPPRK